MNNNMNNEGTNDQQRTVSVTLGGGPNCLTQQTVSFFDAEPGFTTTVDSEPDPTFDVGATEVLGIENWLRRPVEIHTGTWAESATVTSNIKPWLLFFSHLAVQSKIENYALLRCKLMLKIIVNGAPSLYGTMLVSYDPLTNMTPPIDTVSSHGANMMKSQLPHVYIRTQQSQGACMCLPFFFNRNWLDLALASEFEDMGTLFFDSLAPLRSTGGATSDVVTYTVYAWAEDVHLSQTTYAGVLQSDGPISTVASAVANVAGRLATVPIIGRYAQAVNIGAGALSKIASIFGFSRTPVLTPPGYMKNLPFGMLANTGTSELLDRITVDPKQALCLDPRTAGLSNVDELTVSGISTRETLWLQTLWDTTDAKGQILWSLLVTPEAWYAGAGPAGAPTTVIQTALDFAATPFDYWTGDITYRLVFVASQFHRGRLLIQWEPHPGLTPTVLHTNTVVSQIIDLAVTRDFEFTVPYGQTAPFLKLENNHDYASYAIGGAAIPRTAEWGSTNGTLVVSVLNELVSLPGSVADVEVILFVKAGDNFKVAVPRDLDSTLYSIKPGIVLQSDAVDPSSPDEGAPILSAPSNELADVATNDASINQICFGETIVSFRPLLKRYINSRVVTFSGAVGAVMNKLSCVSSRWPLARGLMDDGVEFIGATAGQGNMTNPTLFNYLQGAFVGMRGGSRWKINTISNKASPQINVSRKRTTLTTSGYSSIITTALTSRRGVMSFLTTSFGFAGGTLTNGRTQMGVEVEIPHYSRFRFITASPYACVLGRAAEETTNDSMTVESLVLDTITSPAQEAFAMYHAVADDFNFFFYRFAPPLYRDALFVET